MGRFMVRRDCQLCMNWIKKSPFSHHASVRTRLHQIGIDPGESLPPMFRVLLSATVAATIAVPSVAQTVGNETVCFVPGYFDCASVAVDEINRAQRLVDMQCDGLTEPHIAQVLFQARQRGVQVRLIVDKIDPKKRDGKTIMLAQAGIPVWVDYVPRIVHNKVMVIDGAVLLASSFNWTSETTCRAHVFAST